jgi:hypothetical protein
MIKRPTWILLLLLVLSLVGYLLINNRQKATLAESTPTDLANAYLITSADGALQVLRIMDKQGRNFQMHRDSTGSWQVTLPSQGTADQGLAEAAITQVGALRIITTVDNQLNLSDAGLDTPAYTFEFTFAGDIKHVVQVGGLTPINNGYYVQLDGVNLYVISQAGIDALVNLVTSPPFPATETPTPTLEISSTPTMLGITPQSTLGLPTSTP